MYLSDIYRLKVITLLKHQQTNIILRVKGYFVIACRKRGEGVVTREESERERKERKGKANARTEKH